MTFIIAPAIAILLLCLLVAAARAGRARRGPRRYATWCGASEPTPALVERHEAACPDCQRIIRQLKETS